jgi:hypothetical protein
LKREVTVETGIPLPEDEPLEMSIPLQSALMEGGFTAFAHASYT